jgi:ketosteroid isomerase-like protein
VSENLDLVRSIYADWERGDFSRADWADPEISFVMADGPLPGEWRGVGVMVTIWSKFLATMNDYRAEIEALRDTEDGRVLVLVRGHGRGITSGAAVEDRSANVIEIRDGKVTRLAIYNDRDRAVADLGLTPEQQDDPR